MAGCIDIMVDLETTGTDPSHAAIIQIAAARFDIETKETMPGFFDRCLWIPSGRYWAEDTRTWWHQQPPEVLRGIYDRMENPREVMREFFNWVKDIVALEPIRMWAKPTSFEYPFLASYFGQFDLHVPFGFRHARDVNTYIFAKDHDPVTYWKGVEMSGQAHNAVDDVFYQIKGVLLA